MDDRKQTMAENAISGPCPQCGQASEHAFMPAVAGQTSPAEESARPDIGIRRRFVCGSCEQSWEAAIVPAEQMKQLRTAVESLAEAKRQIAMLRLIMSKDQLERAEKSRGEVIKIHRAA